jgi:hypothetical protein
MNSLELAGCDRDETTDLIKLVSPADAAYVDQA